MIDHARIRPATEADIPTIHALAHAIWPVSYKEILSPAQLTYMLGLMYSATALEDQFASGHLFLLALHEGRAIGFGGMEHGYHGKRSTRLHKLYILPEAQRRGAGLALLRSVEQAARNAGDVQLELNVNRFNKARAWYEHHGFVIVRDEVIDIGGGFVMDDHVMTLDLGVRRD